MPPCDPATAFFPCFITQHDSSSSSRLSLCPTSFHVARFRCAIVPSPEATTSVPAGLPAAAEAAFATASSTSAAADAGTW
eukprot:29580-Pelagococcus_subviridis.AAC.6